LSTLLTDDGPVNLALNDLHLCRAELITHFDDRPTVAKFPKSLGENFQTEVPLFCTYLNFLRAQCRIGQMKLPYQERARLLCRFVRTSICETHRHRQR